MIKQKDKDAITRALRSGVVPRVGLQHLQVGRYNEIRSFLRDIENVAEGGTSFRIVIGEYGSGKTFFLSLARSMAMEKGLVTMNADLSPTKKLNGRDGQTRSLLSELVASLATRTRQDGGALQTVLERFIANAHQKAEAEGITPLQACSAMLRALNEYPGGFAFARVVDIYCGAYETANDMLMDSALRWLRCEYSTKTDSMKALGVREFIDDKSFYNTLVLYSQLSRLAGYKGLFVCLDEMVNLYKITNATSRKANYEEILNILNNTLQGTVGNLGIVMSGTPEFLTDAARGLYSYEALRSRLNENSFSKTLGLNDYDSTVLRLPNLTPEEMLILLQNIREVFALGDKNKYLVPDEALQAYLKHCNDKIGEAYFRTPRNSIKGFVDMLSMLQQYPEMKWQDMIDGIDIETDREGDTQISVDAAPLPPEQSELFSSFKL